MVIYVYTPRCVVYPYGTVGSLARVDPPRFEAPLQSRLFAVRHNRVAFVIYFQTISTACPRRCARAIHVSFTLSSSSCLVSGNRYLKKILCIRTSGNINIFPFAKIKKQNVTIIIPFDFPFFNQRQTKTTQPIKKLFLPIDS